VDQFLPRQPHSVYPLFQIPVDSTCVVWSHTGVGLQANALPLIYSGSSAAGKIICTVSTSVSLYAIAGDTQICGFCRAGATVSHICDLSIYIDANLTKENVDLYSVSSCIHTSNALTSLN